MRIKDLKSYWLKKKSIYTDAEGGKYEDYSTTPVKIEANISPLSGRLASELYGLRTNYMLLMLCGASNDIKEGDGLCVYVKMNEKPDYKVVSIKRFSHLVIELEKVI